MKPGYAKMLQTLYDHEISFGIIVQWDGGFEWYLGWSGTISHAKAVGNARTAAEAIEQIWDAAIRNAVENNNEKLRLSLLKKVWEHD
jgi:hypothetical protein